MQVNRSSRNSSSGGGGGGTSEPVTADTTKISTGGAVKVKRVVLLCWLLQLPRWPEYHDSTDIQKTFFGGSNQF